MSENRPIHRGLGLFMVVAFVSFAGLQLNDPDPLGWVLSYSLVAGFWVWALVRPLPSYPVRVLGVVYGLGAAWWWPGRIEGITEEMMSARPHIEQARESGGLLLGALALLLLARLLHSEQSSETADPSA